MPDELIKDEFNYFKNNHFKQLKSVVNKPEENEIILSILWSLLDLFSTALE